VRGGHVGEHREDGAEGGEEESGHTGGETHKEGGEPAEVSERDTEEDTIAAGAGYIV